MKATHRECDEVLARGIPIDWLSRTAAIALSIGNTLSAAGAAPAKLASDLLTIGQMPTGGAGGECALARS